MTRKNIFEKLKDHYNPQEEFSVILHLFKENTLRRFSYLADIKDLTIEQAIDNDVLFLWKQRGCCLNTHDIKKRLCILDCNTSILENMILCLEYMSNMIYLANMKLLQPTYTKTKEFVILEENLNILLEHLHYKKIVFDDEEKVHANVLSEKLYDAVWNYIGTVDKQAHKIIFSLPPNIRNIVEENEEEFTARMRYIYKVQRKLDINRTKMLGDKRIIDVIERLINIYREVFSDVASIVTLNIDEEDFKEAFQISEGIKITEGNKPEEQALREKIVNALLSKKIIENRVSPYYEYGKKARKTLENFYSIKGYMQDRVIENLLFYCWMQRELLVYAETVYQNMEDRVNEECCCKSVKQVRTLFELFKGQPGVECSEIYRHINDIIISYGEKRESEHQRWIDINCT